MTRNRHTFPGWMVLVPVALLFFSCSGTEETDPRSQDPEFRLAKLYYENSTGEVGITTFYYDQSGHNYLSHWQLEDSTRSSWNYCEYDSSGHQTRKYREFNDGTTTDQHFYYDANGLITGQDFTAKDFRTWAGSMYAAIALRTMGPAETQRETQANIVCAIDLVAARLGNTRDVCRKYYVHPRVTEAYQEGVVAKAPAVSSQKRKRRKGQMRRDEVAVLELLYPDRKTKRQSGRGAGKRRRAS